MSSIGTVDVDSSDVTVVGSGHVSSNEDSVVDRIVDSLGVCSSSNISDVIGNNHCVCESGTGVDVVVLPECDILDCPPLHKEAGRDALKKEVLNDDTLKQCRDLADKNLNGYSWSEGVLMYSVLERSVKDKIPVHVCLFGEQVARSSADENGFG